MRMCLDVCRCLCLLMAVLPHQSMAQLKGSGGLSTDNIQLNLANARLNNQIPVAQLRNAPAADTSDVETWSGTDIDEFLDLVDYHQTEGNFGESEFRAELDAKAETGEEFESTVDETWRRYLVPKDTVNKAQQVPSACGKAPLFEPCLSADQSDAVVSTCCGLKDINSDCGPYCRTTWDTTMMWQFLTSKCPSSEREQVWDCVTSSQDQSDCCAAAGLPGLCQDLCKSSIGAELNSVPYGVVIICGEHFANMSRCLQSAVGSQPITERPLTSDQAVTTRPLQDTDGGPQKGSGSVKAKGSGQSNPNVIGPTLSPRRYELLLPRHQAIANRADFIQ